MQDRPVIVKEGGSSVAMFAILAILVLVGLALFVWQPWNANGTSTTKALVQPGAQSGAGSGTTSGSSSGGASGGSSGGGSSH